MRFRGTDQGKISRFEVQEFSLDRENAFPFHAESQFHAVVAVQINDLPLWMTGVVVHVQRTFPLKVERGGLQGIFWLILHGFCLFLRGNS